MAESVDTESESVKVNREYKKKSCSRKSRFPIKNSRRIRRKRSKTRYYKSLKQLRNNRKTDELCTAVEVFDICDMDWAPSVSSTSLPPEVAEWQKQEQIAYWKSRAISLELENRMLHEHLRNVYAKTIEVQSQYREYSENDEDTRKDKNGGKNFKRQRNRECAENEEKPEEAKVIKEVVNPRVPEGKHRLEQLKAIYGDLAPKIMGMETALQLNYERIIEKSQPQYWPSLPLRFTFD